LRTVTSSPVAFENTASTSVPIQDGSTLAADLATPLLITAGKVAPTSPVQLALVTSWTTTSATLSGVDGCGVAIRTRWVRNSPVRVSTTAPLMPLPPMSTPKAASGCPSDVGDAGAVIDPPLTRLVLATISANVRIGDRR